VAFYHVARNNCQALGGHRVIDTQIETPFIVIDTHFEIPVIELLGIL
jgi:hypothetical protein